MEIDKNNFILCQIVEDDLNCRESSNSVKSAKSQKEESTELNIKEETSKDDNLKKFDFQLIQVQSRDEKQKN